MQHPNVEMGPIVDLTPYANNARTHSSKQIAQIARSIERFGFTNPVLIADDGEIIADHGRVAASKELGLVEVPVIKLSHLSEEERRAIHRTFKLNYRKMVRRQLDAQFGSFGHTTNRSLVTR